MGSKILVEVLILNLLLVLGDNLSTYLCLNGSVATTEANPLSAWIFESVGLVEGLTISTVIKTILLYCIHLFYIYRPKLRAILMIGSWLTLFLLIYVNLNNWYIVYLLNS